MTSEIPEIFKTLLEYPFSVPVLDDNETDKEKLGLDDNVDIGGGGSGMGPSAALTPAIWDKTIPYDGENFHLEYMDLEEFLMENGITPSMDEDPPKSSQERVKEKTKATVVARAAQASKAPVTAKAPAVAKAPAGEVGLLPILELDHCEEEVVISSDISTDVTTDQNRMTPEPIKPEEVEVDVNFEPDPTDLVLSSVPGGELFDPRKHKFTDEELKPQPMIKKAKKVLVPEEQKDDKYWQRRKKNNVAAKRSRDARRLKENQITVRAAFLERENMALRTEVAELRKECGRFKNIVTNYESKFGTLPLQEEDS